MENLMGAIGGLSGSSGTGGSSGNEQLSQAFDHAMQQAAQTLSITTVKGAALYALKQRPQ
ncbi:MAG: hypothetical protein KDJ16_16335 [Hyphomicrobiales bacterium]|nr:hypothetical protein [Hyphomicrobiales bacterium]